MRVRARPRDDECYRPPHRSSVSPTSFFMSRRARALVALSATVVGATLFAATAQVAGAAIVLAGMAGALAVPVGGAKTATACGLNALASFDRRNRDPARQIASAVLYAIVATSTASLLGLGLTVAGTLLFDQRTRLGGDRANHHVRALDPYSPAHPSPPRDESEDRAN